MTGHRDQSLTDDVEIVGVGQALELLGIGRATLYRLERAGDLTRFEPGGPPRFRRSDLEALALTRSRADEAARRDVDALRRRILTAAATVVTQQGVEALTVEAVAVASGLTRGGVLYHFTHKDAILRGLIEAFVEEFERDWEQELDRLPEHLPGRQSRAYVAATHRVNEADSLSAALVAVVIADQATRLRLHERVRDWYGRVADEDAEQGSGGVGVQACLAADGYWVLSLLGLRPLASPPSPSSG